MTMPGVGGRGASGLSSSTPCTTSSRGVLGPLAPRRGAVEHFARSSSDTCREVDGFVEEVKSAVLSLAGARAGKVKSTVPLTTVSSAALKVAEERWRSQVVGLGAAPARIQRRALLDGGLALDRHLLPREFYDNETVRCGSSSSGPRGRGASKKN